MAGPAVPGAAVPFPATVVIFPNNKDLWTYSSRYMRTARPDTNGKYSFKALPPHEDYMIIAVQNLEQGQGADPEFLRIVDLESRHIVIIPDGPRHKLAKATDKTMKRVQSDEKGIRSKSKCLFWYS